MGQRLVVNLIGKEEILANAYYHWSGYTSSSLELVEKILLHQLANGTVENKLQAIRTLEATEAAITGDESEEAKKQFPSERFAPFKGRNEGILRFTPDEVDALAESGEYSLDIDYVNQVVNFFVMNVYEDLEDFFETAEITQEEFDSLPAIKGDGMCIPFEDFFDFKQTIREQINKHSYVLRTEGGAGILLVE